MSIKENLEDMGLTESQVIAVEQLFEQTCRREALYYASELIHRIFLRVDRDSVVGRALARALGFTNDVSLARAAKAFEVSKQYLHRIQSEIEAKTRRGWPENSPQSADSKKSGSLLGSIPTQE